ncbi:MAG: hypothetical protein O7B35_03990 [Deltaproteobacteria bacterium]|nr:hypothetical protein [Deltaproteobacteria bacterium]
MGSELSDNKQIWPHLGLIANEVANFKKYLLIRVSRMESLIEEAATLKALDRDLTDKNQDLDERIREKAKLLESYHADGIIALEESQVMEESQEIIPQWLRRSG